MNEKDLKKVIKQLVRESLTEIFAEMHLESIVEGVVKRQVRVQPQSQPSQRSFSSVITERAQAQETDEEPESKLPVRSKEELRQMIQQRVGVTDNEWSSIYADTASSDNPIVTGESDAKPELVSESTLADMGLMKDYSKFVK